MQNNDPNTNTDNTPENDPAVQAGLDWAVETVRNALNGDRKRN